ncbi:hypothetical protein [Amycolatopsis sp. Hca4]|uniref:hypothetical protein n=1 Tax=Amycolatopsis sp. Hca4 TaxID=2742131 RepID=UPI00158FA0FF|nr:hypothetical protein [Amycolatopsis sp. Hca4]QKV73682.1 hypothetical protein HUT10_07760 [Amycolatopsis sp. Hca4]
MGRARTAAGPALADAAIVGSALVETLLATDDEATGRAGLERLTTQLAAGVRTRTA